MKITVGTFNLNNLFSRFNFQGAINEIKKADGSVGAVTVRYEFTDENNFQVRKFLGKLVKEKERGETDKIAARILSMNVDVLAVQEVEDIDILREFNKAELGGLYKHEILIEGNDPRFIDVGILSKFPIGAVTSFQTATHEQDPARPVFSRDLLEVEVMSGNGKTKLFTLYNNHLKSHFGDDDDGGAGKAKNDARRKKQAETIAEIVASRNRPNSKYIITGDMNDAVDATPLQPMLSIEENPLINALAHPTETRPAKAESSGHNPPNASWTHRFISGGIPEHHLFDQIWLSPKLAPFQTGAFIDRRKLHRGDGSDHDPAWIELDL